MRIELGSHSNLAVGQNPSTGWIDGAVAKLVGMAYVAAWDEGSARIAIRAEGTKPAARQKAFRLREDALKRLSRALGTAEWFGLPTALLQGLAARGLRHSPNRNLPPWCAETLLWSARLPKPAPKKPAKRRAPVRRAGF